MIVFRLVVLSEQIVAACEKQSLTMTVKRTDDWFASYSENTIALRSPIELPDAIGTGIMTALLKDADYREAFNPNVDWQRVPFDLSLHEY